VMVFKENGLILMNLKGMERGGEGGPVRKKCRSSLELKGRLNIFLKIEDHQD